jgi:hypothetical protein
MTPILLATVLLAVLGLWIPAAILFAPARSGLRLLARLLGYLLAGFGWFLFAVAVIGMLTNDPPGAAFFRLIGFWVVPGWLLLRLAAGLFPFSLRLFR